MYQADQEEKKILDFWEKDKTFEKSVEQRPKDKPYVFYDGPPFATGLPHYGHILSSVIKDVVPRYFTMKGYRVPRRWGWDCHGLPIENMIEKEMGFSGKKEIEKFGVDKFNDACRSKVQMYSNEWKKMVTRIARWTEFDNSYKTMDSTYMESIWWALKTIWDKGLIYEGRKVLMYCPHCETPISKAEVAMDNSYKDITEEAVTIKFRVLEPEKHGLPSNTFVLAWTTTPWTLPGNLALAVGKEIHYKAFTLEGQKGQTYVAASDLVGKLVGGKYSTVKEFTGGELVGLDYEPLFNMPAMREGGKKAYYIVDADFVTIEEGTGVVHTAVVYGEDDYNLGLEKDLPVVPMLDEVGVFNEVAPEFIQGKYFKDAEKPIKADLEQRGLIFTREQNTHSYPHCWRCGTQVIYNAISAWFINIQKVKQRALELNEKINWYPEHLKHGRFQNILETAPDWNISRNRYWATALPFWKCDNVRNTNDTKIQNECNNVVCIGSVQELKEKALNFDEVYKTDDVEKIDLHKHFADRIKLACEKCGGTMTRIPEVIDCWVESGSMYYASLHYPFENKAEFKASFPGQYIAEYISQVRAWFYYMHLTSVLLFDDVSFENVVTTGNVLNDKGEKLSKSKNNFKDPWIMIGEYGIDAIRFYMMSSVVMQAEKIEFNEREVREVYNKVINMLSNVLEFYKMYSNRESGTRDQGPVERENILDKWILAKLQELTKEVTINMDNYNTVKASRPIKEFIDELSTWYVRRSRDRFKLGEEKDKQAAVTTLQEVLLTLAKLTAPFTPFIAEKVWQEVKLDKDLPKQASKFKPSVHLADWPEVNERYHDRKVLEAMEVVRKIVELGLSARAAEGIKVRQPLAELRVNNEHLSHELSKIICEELNVKKVDFADEVVEGGWSVKEDGAVKVWLNVEINNELKKEGIVRELVRAINKLRKEAKLTVNDRVELYYVTSSEVVKEIMTEYNKELSEQVVASKLTMGEAGKGAVIKVNGLELEIELKSV